MFKVSKNEQDFEVYQQKKPTIVAQHSNACLKSNNGPCRIMTCLHKEI